MQLPQSLLAASVVSLAIFQPMHLRAEATSPAEMWKDYDPRIDPLNEEITREWKEEGIQFKEIRFDGEESQGERTRIYGIYAAPAGGENLPGILHIHGGGQTANQDWCKYWAGRGYAILSINWGGEWPDREKFTKYPDSLPQGNHKKSSGIAGAPSMWENSWMVWTRVCRRALTALESQKEVDAIRLGAFGVSMGGSLMWNLATDPRIKAGCAVYGAGWDTYSHKEPKFAIPPVTQTITPEVATWRRLAAPEAYASMVHFPMLFLNASNDQHGDTDRVLDSLGLMPPEVARRHGITPRFRHHINVDFMGNLPAWMDHYLKGAPALPETPKLSMEIDASGIPILKVSPDSSQPVEKVEIYYALEYPHAVSRHWRLAASGKDVREASAPFMNPEGYVIAFANVHYPNQVTLTSELLSFIPASIPGATATLTPKTLLFGTDEPDGGWTRLGYGTDPMPDIIKKMSYYPQIAEHSGKLGVAPDPIAGMATWKPGDPQFKPTSNAKALEFMVLAPAGAQLEVMVHSSYYAPGQRSFTASVSLPAEEGWQNVSLEPSQFSEIKRGKLTDPAVLLENFDGVNFLEINPPNRDAWKKSPPVFTDFSWGQSSE